MYFIFFLLLIWFCWLIILFYKVRDIFFVFNIMDIILILSRVILTSIIEESSIWIYLLYIIPKKNGNIEIH